MKSPSRSQGRESAPRHPFTWLSVKGRWIALVVLIAATVALAVQLMALDRPLKERVGGGIISFELAWSEARASEILDAWQGLEDVVTRQTQLDFGFLVLYPLALSLACALLAERKSRLLARTGSVLSWAVLAAGPLDAVENLAMLSMLEHGAAAMQARIAGACATLKFGLVLLALVYLACHAAAGLVAILRRRRPGPAPG